jgi:hypothetical protein
LAISSYDWIINIIFHYNFFSSAGQAVGRSIGEASSWLLRVLRRGCGQHPRHHNLGDWELLPQSGESSVNSYRVLLFIFYCCLVNIRVFLPQFYLQNNERYWRFCKGNALKSFKIRPAPWFVISVNWGGGGGETWERKREFNRKIKIWLSDQKWTTGFF